MKTTLRIAHFLFVLSLFCFVASSATAQEGFTNSDNDRYGETRWNKLPKAATISKDIWVGSWWAYKKDGIACRWHAGTYGCTNSATNMDRWSKENADALEIDKHSPSEKFDRLMGRSDKIEYDKIVTYLGGLHAKTAEINELILERRDLIYKLNAWIEENAGEEWRETEDGKRYLEITKTIDTAQDETKHDFEIDTATEFEILHHGNGQFGLESWYGHCNAWAAASVMDPEPRYRTEVDGIPFEAADVKALLTETWMEAHSSFFGSRNDYDKDSAAREKINFKDVTPAAFHIFFADQVGNKDRSFVIDRYTGSQVWNQPVKAYRVLSAEPLYETPEEENAEAIPVEVDLKVTRYSWTGAEEVELGKKKVYPVKITTTIHWMTDGVPPEELTVEYTSEIDDETFADTMRINEMFDDQVEIRTLGYTLYLDRPMDDPDARIIGDGEWNHGQTGGYTALHPDFMWQPQSNRPSGSREYENPFIDYEVLLEKILPGATTSPEELAAIPVEPTIVSAQDLPVAIPDNDEAGIISELIIADELMITDTHILRITVEHTYIGDLRVRLLGPNGRTRLVKHFGSGGSADNYTKVLDLKKWLDTDAQGTWSLEVIDNAGIDTGDITQFEFEIK
ncbi:MAG: hypothetical protein CMH54_06020 [Myxococcales bacterium]|nr:hypothetical protein [Myxococcales bacterium]